MKLPSSFARRAAAWLPALVVVLAASCGGGDGDDMPMPPAPLPSPNVLVVAPAEGAPGTSVQLALGLENPLALTGLQFDLLYDPAILSVTGVGITGRSAGFEAELNDDSGTAHVVLVDLAGTATIDAGMGSVATVTVAVASGAPAGPSLLLVDHARAVDETATPLSVGGSAATFTVR